MILQPGHRNTLAVVVVDAVFDDHAALQIDEHDLAQRLAVSRRDLLHESRLTGRGFDLQLRSRDLHNARFPAEVVVPLLIAALVAMFMLLASP